MSTRPSRAHVSGCLALLLCGATPAIGQLAPVIGPGATAFDPEVNVVNSGEVLDASAVVSGDMKYVTITTVAQSSRLIALRPFPVQAVAGGGNVGGVGNNGSLNNAPGDGVGFSPGAFPLRLTPSREELADPAILDRRGMIRLSTGSNSNGSPR